MATEVLVALITGGVTLLNLIISGFMNHLTKKHTQKVADQSEYQDEVKTKLNV